MEEPKDEGKMEINYTVVCFMINSPWFWSWKIFGRSKVKVPPVSRTLMNFNHPFLKESVDKAVASSTLSLIKIFSKLRQTHSQQLSQNLVRHKRSWKENIIRIINCFAYVNNKIINFAFKVWRVVHQCEQGQAVQNTEDAKVSALWRTLSRQGPFLRDTQNYTVLERNTLLACQ